MHELRIQRFRGGLCVVWYEDGRRKRYQLASRARKEAEAEALDVYRRETYVARPANPTVAEIWDAYRDHLGDRPAGVTMGYTGKAILPHFGPYVPENIDKSLCFGYAEKRGKQGISQGSIWTELGHLRSALKFAVQAKMIKDAPHIWRPAKPQKDMRILNAGEARALIEAASAPHIRLALILLLGTAGRVGAILDLTWDRVDFDRDEIRLRVDGAQTRKGRANVPMNGMTRAALQTASDAALSDYVVEYAGGRVGKIRKGFTNAVERAGIGHVRIHDLRHTAAVTMLAAGVPIEMVSQVLGHSNTQITFSTYARYLPQHMAPAVDVLNFMELKGVR